MNLTALSTSTNVILAGGLLLFIGLFFSWQQACAGVSGFHVCGTRSGWSGWGVILGLCVIALLAWEGLQLAGVEVSIGISPVFVTVGLAGATLLFALIKFLADNTARHWPSWAGLILAIAVAVGGWLRLSGGAPTPIRAVQQPPAPG